MRSWLSWKHWRHIRIPTRRWVSLSATGKAIWTCWRSVGPVRLNRQTCWAILTVEQVNIKSPKYEETAETVRGKVETVRAIYVDLELSPSVWSGMPLFVNFSAYSGRGWDTVGKKCMFNYFFRACWGHRAASVCTGKNTKCTGEHKGRVQVELCVKTEWWNWAVLENWELVSNRRKWTKEAMLQWQRKKQREGWIAFSFLWENLCTKLKPFWSKARIKRHDNILSRSIQITFKVNLCRLISKLDLLIYLVHVESLN